jgi:predicted Zn-dependent peptidase
MDELKRLGEGIPEEELTKARELAKGRMLLRLEDTRSVSGWLGGQEILTSHILTPEDVVERLDAVTIEDLVRVARALANRDHMNLALVGPHRSERVFVPLLEI